MASSSIIDVIAPSPIIIFLSKARMAGLTIEEITSYKEFINDLHESIIKQIELCNDEKSSLEKFRNALSSKNEPSITGSPRGQKFARKAHEVVTISHLHDIAAASIEDIEEVLRKLQGQLSKVSECSRNVSEVLREKNATRKSY